MNNPDEPQTVQALGAMINGRRKIEAAEDKVGAMHNAFAIYTNLKWTLKKKDYTPKEAMAEIEKAKEETRKKVLHPQVQQQALATYDEMVKKLKGQQ